MAVYYRQMLDAVHSVAGVSERRWSPACRCNITATACLYPGRRPAYADPSQRPGVGFQSVSPDFYKTFGIQIVKGAALPIRTMPPACASPSSTRSSCASYLKGLDPFKQRSRSKKSSPASPSLGLPSNGRSSASRTPFATITSAMTTRRSTCLSPSRWRGRDIGVRTQSDPASMAKAVAAAVHTVDSQVALADIATMDQVKSRRPDRRPLHHAALCRLRLSSRFLLAAVGIYGLMTFTVSQRTQEIGIRMALGASRGNVAALIVRQGAMLALVGLLLGVGGAVLWAARCKHALRSRRAGWRSSQRLRGSVCGTALFASYLPARRAAAIDPMQALRSE
jgi:putative ABC transport system permease protein